jgi:hypothetical protein
MEWYEIIATIILVIVGALLRCKLKEYRRRFFSGYNDSWWDRKKK